MIDARVDRSQAEQWFIAALAIAFAGGGLQILQWAAARPLWLDEEMIALNVRDRVLTDLAGPLWLDQSAPFGWLALQRAAVLWLGTSELAMRFVPVLFGLGTLATAVWVGRQWMSPLGASLLVLLCSIGQWISLYSLELKQYSGDIFWSLLLPALAVWVAEAPADSLSARRRAMGWWAAAAAALWFANGALLVTPACATVLFLLAWRQRGWRGAVRAALPGLMWAASFGVHYLSTLRYTLGSPFLKDYWSFALPPTAAGLRGTIAWLAAQVAPFAVMPGGATQWVAFWIVVIAGFGLLTRHRPALGLAFGLIPVSAFAMAACRIAPLYERLSLWVVPALYVAVAACADEGVRIVRSALRERRWIIATPGAIAAIMALLVCLDLSKRGVDDLRISRPQFSNHALNDREALAWLTSQRQPNDDLMTTRFGLPAAWWYGHVPISGPYRGAGYARDAGRVLEVRHGRPGRACGTNTFADTLAGRSRVLLYLGFRFDDVPKGFDEMLRHDLSELGAVVADRQFDGRSRAIVVDLRQPPTIEDREQAQRADAPPRPAGCLTVQLAERW